MVEQPRDPYPGNRYDWRSDWLLALGGLIAIVLMLYGSAIILNKQFYKTYSPFYDSAAYHNYVATVVGVFETQGTFAALRYALDANTAPLPGLETAVLARLGWVTSPVSRLLGIQLQTIWVMALAIALYFYWFGFRRASAWLAVALSLPFVMFTGLFNFNGGLLDFRLDLSLYLLFSLTVVIYLMTEHIDSYGIWIGMGFAAALACLTRATAPVYLVVALGPPWIVRFALSDRRLDLLKKTLVMLIPFALFGLSYFFYNFANLYYYYVVWSADANAHLPWSESVKHFTFAWRALGTPLGVAGLVCLAAILIENARSIRRPGDIDWKLLWIGCAPALFLAWRGAGWNPFVAMPSIFGWMMFALSPLRNPPVMPRTPITAMGFIAVVLACGWNLMEAPLQAQPDWPAQMSAMRGGIDAMRADAASKGLREVRFTSIHLWYYHAVFMRDVLIHEYAGRALPDRVVLPDGLSLYVYREPDFATPTKMDWDRQQGATDDEKIRNLVEDAKAHLDYILMPDDETVTNVEKHIPHNYANLVVRRLRQKLLDTGDWQPVSGKLAISPVESVQIYARSTRPAGQSTTAPRP